MSELATMLRALRYLPNVFSPRPVADPEANLGVSRGQKGKSGGVVPPPVDEGSPHPRENLKKNEAK